MTDSAARIKGKHANIYLEAAKRVGDTWWSCHAISAADGGEEGYREKPAVQAYVAMFSHDGVMDHFTEEVGRLKDQKGWRLTALCFAAAMHDAGDL